MYTHLDEIVLGARYKEVITGFVGTCTVKEQMLTGCDRVVLEGEAKEGGKSEAIGCDITSIEYVDEGVSKRFEVFERNKQEALASATSTAPAPKPGAAITRGRRATSR